MNQQLQQPPLSQVVRLEDFVSAEAGLSTAPVDSTDTQPSMTHGSGVQGISAQEAHAGLLPAPFGLAPTEQSTASTSDEGATANLPEFGSLLSSTGVHSTHNWGQPAQAVPFPQPFVPPEQTPMTSFDSPIIIDDAHTAHVSVCIVNGEDMNSIVSLRGRTELGLFPFMCPWCRTVFCVRVHPDGSFELDETESGQPVPLNWIHGVHVHHAFCPVCVYTGFVFEVEMEPARHP